MPAAEMLSIVPCLRSSMKSQLEPNFHDLEFLMISMRNISSNLLSALFFTMYTSSFKPLEVTDFLKLWIPINSWLLWFLV